MHYTGIGSRLTPQHVLDTMMICGKVLGDKGLILRSGGAAGADSAFEVGAAIGNGPKEIYIPWNGFRNRSTREIGVYLPTGHIREEAEYLAKQYHPAWHNCSPTAKVLHIRNMYQILGKDLKTPSHMVLCYTVDGFGQGGTGQAIRAARDHNIPVYDMGKQEVYDEIIERLGDQTLE